MSRTKFKVKTLSKSILNQFRPEERVYVKHVKAEGCIHKRMIYLAKEIREIAKSNLTSDDEKERKDAREVMKIVNGIEEKTILLKSTGQIK